jgi:hypothetical protein
MKDSCVVCDWPLERRRTDTWYPLCRACIPRRPSDPRPLNRPFYIDKDCPECGTRLALLDDVQDNDCESWYDEWICPECQDGVHMDWPESHWDWLVNRADRA